MQLQSKNTHPQASAREVLRSTTKDLHQQLDSHPSIRSLLKKDLNHTEHLAVLAKFYRAYSKIELKIIEFEKNNFPEKLPKYAPRLMALTNDLADNISKKEHDFHSRSSSYIAYKQLSLPQYWGARYVLDGSCHGASMLLPKLTSYYATDSPPLAYWNLLAGLTKDWPSVCQQIELVGDCTKALNEMTTMARLVFTDFINS